MRMTTMQGRTGKSVAVAGTFASILLSAPALAAAEAAPQPALSTTFMAELFACFAFVLLAVGAHWAARRQRTRS